MRLEWWRIAKHDVYILAAVQEQRWSFTLGCDSRNAPCHLAWQERKVGLGREPHLPVAQGGRGLMAMFTPAFLAFQPHSPA